MREVQECRRRVREGMLLRVHLELPRHTLVVPVRDLPLACCRNVDEQAVLLVVVVPSQVVVVCFVAHSFIRIDSSPQPLCVREH